MTFKKATITIEIEGGIDMDFSQTNGLVSRDVIKKILETLKKRTIYIYDIDEKLIRESIPNCFSGRPIIEHTYTKQDVILLGLNNRAQAQEGV